ncbi:MAG: hypothetical protein KDK70_41310, partial [Myxococcales bacterium]|nr:hypothetical protein [Myxococcales bacterium]
YAWLYSEWSDGHGPGEGIQTKRQTLLSVTHGRPVWSQTVVDHRFHQPAAEGGSAPVVRTWTLESADGCPGSLAAAGWVRPPGLAEHELELRDALAHTDELRKNTKRSGWDSEAPPE